MYAREVPGRVLTFGVSGKLMMNALVMYDRETDSLWSQALGSAVAGDYAGTEPAGTELDVVAVAHVRWSTWLERYPNTLVLDQGGLAVSPCAEYYGIDED